MVWMLGEFESRRSAFRGWEVDEGGVPRKREREMSRCFEPVRGDKGRSIRGGGRGVEGTRKEKLEDWNKMAEYVLVGIKVDS